MNLSEICNKKFDESGLKGDPRYVKRLRWELEEIIAKEKENYFLDLFNRNVKYDHNENNLFTCWLLGITPDFDIEKNPNCVVTGDFPDIDLDYIKVVRDYLKNEWAPKTFGEEHVCNIGNYTTFGIKSALIDMARVHGLPRGEILELTKEIKSTDEDGDPMTWDAALRMNDDLREYCENNPEVAKAANKLIDRIRGMGVHAGGLIISKVPLTDLVPLVKNKVSNQASAWPEGLSGQDLQPVGLIKFDLLVISNLLQIARCCELIKKRHKIDGICNRPGMPDWTDVEKWRSDPKAIELANKGDLKCVFQYDSPGIRDLVKRGGVTSFEDLVAYSALYRPGCLSCGMTERYVQRKLGKEKYSLHPIMQPILSKTYGVMVYQEQIMKILHVVGDIPLKDCEFIRKAISKKKLESFIKYKEKFIIEGQKKLSVSEKEIVDLWSQIETFSEYGFNKSHAVAYAYLSMWLIYLKAHYLHDFYTSVLTCETLDSKIKDYKMEAKSHGVEMHPLDINLSKQDFELGEDNVIYYGFSKVKGIGPVPAEKIVANQPYNSFEDFLRKFGTDSAVLKPLIGLRCFKEADPITLWKFSEHYKDCLNKIEGKKKRLIEAESKYEEEFKNLCPEETVKLSELSGNNPFDEKYWKEKYNFDKTIEVVKNVKCKNPDEGLFSKLEHIDHKEFGEDEGFYVESMVLNHYKKSNIKKVFNKWKELKKIWVKHKKYINKKTQFAEILPTLNNFDASKFEINPEIEKILLDPIACENEFYGFEWIHPLELSPDYLGNFDFENIKSDSNASVKPVEVRILKIEKKQSKKNKNFNFYTVTAEDVYGQKNLICIWQDDYDIWQEELKPNNLIRMRLHPPTNGFSTFTLESNRIGKFGKQKRYVTKEEDPRIYLLRKQENKVQVMSDEEALEQFMNCKME